MLASDSQKPSN